MFKAIHQPTGEEIIILDSQWVDLVSMLRLQSAEDLLVCQECRQPVRVRAGEVKRWHFAHKHKADCPYEGESPALLQARALLYGRLSTEFGSQVTLEKRVEDADLPRAIDCWVEREKGSFAFWILDTNLSRARRERLLGAFSELDVRVHWVFVADLLQTSVNKPHELHLSPSQRKFLQSSSFEPLYQPGTTLHFLNAQTQVLTTFRGLQLLHPPQVFCGHHLETPLSEVGIARGTGEFVHPGEKEKWLVYRDEQKQRQQQKREDDEARQQREREHQQKEQEERAERARQRVEQRAGQKETLLRTRGEGRKRCCILCGQVTADWWFRGDSPQTCKCNECIQKGLY